ncbi:Ricin B-type lectin domain-containing protein [Mycena chlorophos]|uniref:Ricin B-type lectin domain-containing protein n=1 Tax=Mycena chlorophos TaxID=658473 RepID=A0A8H6SMF0_MYCCL|nr:Ricin B-type lectin domain-containing protein [Mycena chlorophos]
MARSGTSSRRVPSTSVHPLHPKADLTVGFQAISESAPLWRCRGAGPQNNQSSPQMHFSTLASLVVVVGFGTLRVAAQFQLVDPFAEMQRPQAANTASGTPVYTNMLIQDYQNGNADLAYRATYDLAPIQSLENKPDEKAQQWNFTTTGNKGEYIIQNVASGTFMSYTLVGVPDAAANLAASQVCGNNAQLVWTFYRPVGDESTTFLMSPDPYDPLNPPKVAVRSWPSGGSTIVGDTNPLTLEHIDGKDEQQRFSLDPGPSTAPQS